MKSNLLFQKIKSHSANLAFIAFIVVLFAACSRETQQISFAFYNVENLFDTIDDPNINDGSHLPDSKIPWNSERYQTKLDNLSKVMSSVDSGNYPTLFGLCEVENLEDRKSVV